MHPGTRVARCRAELGEWIEGARVDVAGLQADDRRAGQAWQAVGANAALAVDRKARDLPATDEEATLVEPDGETGRAFLTFGNYRAVLRYNCANFYAIAVGRLADLVKQ